MKSNSRGGFYKFYKKGLASDFEHELDYTIYGS